MVPTFCLRAAAVLSIVLVLLVFAGAGGLQPGAWAAEGFAPIEEILRELDALSTFEDSDFSAVLTVITEEPEKGVEQTVVRQFRRDREDQFAMIIQEPRVQRGQGYLMDGENLWFYDPSSRQFSHTSLKEAFQDSDARNSDFGGWSYAEDYEITEYSEGKLGANDVYIVSLAALHDAVTYPFVKLWVTRENALLLKVEEYSLTERLMRTALFPSYARVGDSVIPRQMVFVDELAVGQRTQITFSEMSVQAIPDYVFTRAYLEQVNR